MASGDLFVALETIAATLFHVAGGIFILSYAKLKGIRLLAIAVYLVTLTMSWMWIIFVPLLDTMIPSLLVFFLPVSIPLIFWLHLCRKEKG